MSISPINLIFCRQEAKSKESTYVKRKQNDIILPGLNLVHETITKLDPDNNAFETKEGNRVTYDYLIASPGVTLRYDRIEGAAEALAEPDCPVGSIYRLEYAYKTSKFREAFRGGKAIFMLPQMPVKCGGAP
jgi:sulfide:quinone oxidoreductase